MREREPPAWIVPFALLVASIVLLTVKVFESDGLPRYRALRAEQRAMTARNERVRSEIRALRLEVRALREDPGAIERVARDELGLVRSGEFVFQFDGRDDRAPR